MANANYFDNELNLAQWFDHCKDPLAWFDDDLVSVTATSLITVALSGLVETASQGSLDTAESNVVTLSGQSETIQQEVLSKTVSVALSGLIETIDQGSIDTNESIGILLDGQSYVIQQGTLFNTISVGLNNLVETISQDVVIPSVGTTIVLSGQLESYLQSDLKLDLSANSSGQNYVDNQGNITPSGSGSGSTVISVIGSGKKSSYKPLTYKDRKDIDKKVYEYLFNVVEEVLDGSEVASNIDNVHALSAGVADSILDSNPNISDVFVREDIFNNGYLAEIARLQAFLEIEKIKQQIEQDDEEALLLLLH